MVIGGLIARVTPGSAALLDLLLWAGDEAQKPAILRMSDQTRAKVLAVLAGLMILGLAMMALAWLGARMTRRYMNRCSTDGVRSESTPVEDDWTEKPMQAHANPLDNSSESN